MGIEFKDDIEDTGDASADLLNVEEAGQMEEETQPETINEEATEEENISLTGEIPEDSEDYFSEFNEEESSNDIAEAAEVLTEEIESERKIGFFGRLARSFSFGSKN